MAFSGRKRPASGTKEGEARAARWERRERGDGRGDLRFTMQRYNRGWAILRHFKTK